MKQVAAALDFGTSKVVCVVGELRGYNRFDIQGSGVCEYDGYRQGHWLRPENLTDVIHTAVREAEIHSRKRVKEIYVGVPGEYCRVVCSKASIDIEGRDNKVTERDVERLLAKTEEIYHPDRYKVVHCTPVYYLTDKNKKIIYPVGVKTTKLSGFISYVLADVFFINDVTKRANELGMEVQTFVSDALAQTLLLVPAEDRDRTAVLVDVGFYNTQVAIVEGDGIDRKSTRLNSSH